MHVIAELSIVPLAAGASISDEVAACEELIRDAGLDYEVHANGTNMAGDMNAVFGAVKRCHDHLHAKGVARVTSTLRLDSRTDREQTLERRTAGAARAATASSD